MDDFLKPVRAFYERVLNLSSPRRDLPFLPEGFDLDTRRPLTGRDGHVISNVASQQILLRGLAGLTALTGDRRYERRARRIMRVFLQRYQNPRTGLLPWGGHMYLDCDTGEPVSAVTKTKRIHELKFHFPFYDLMWQADAKRTLRFIEGFWKAHVWNWETLIFSRHAEVTRGRYRQKGSNALTFLNTGTDLIVSAGFAYGRSGNGEYLRWAKRLTARYEGVRHPRTGLGAYQFNLRPAGPEEAQLGHLGITSMNLCPYAHAVAQSAVGLMRLSQQLPKPDGAPFLAYAHAALIAYGKYGYDPSDGSFHGMLRTETGKRIKSPQVLRQHKGPYSHDYWSRFKFAANQNLGQMLFAWAMALRLTADDALWPTLNRLTRLIGLRRKKDWPGPGIRKDLLTTWDTGYTIQGLLELAEATGKTTYLDRARHIAQWSLKTFMKEGWLLPWRGARQSKFNQRLLPALLRLEAFQRGLPNAVPDDWAGTEGFIDWKPRNRSNRLWIIPGRKFTRFM